MIDPAAAFKALDIRAGTIVSAERLAGVRIAAYRLAVDFGGSVGVKHCAAQITDRYAPESLTGKQVLAAINLPAKKIGPFLSEALVLGVPDPSGRVVLVCPDFPVPDGAKLF